MNAVNLHARRDPELRVSVRQYEDRYPNIKAYNFSVPIDHFHNESSTERLPYLQHGIVPILTKATGGVGLIMEHRYYGTSFPVPDLTTESLRFLTTEQALADTAYFAEHVRFPGLEHLDLTASKAPWIIYGVLFGDDRAKVRGFKQLFGLGDLDDDDFATTISRGLYGLQSTNWDPEEDVSSLGIYCAVVTSNFQLFASTTHLIPTVQDLVAKAGYAAEAEVLSVRMLNYIGYVRDYVKTDLEKGCKGKSVLECFSPRYSTPNDTSLNAGWLRSWSWQVCTQWGYFVTGSGTPRDQLPMISRAITLESASSHCERLFNITTSPDVESINKLGGFNFSYPRLAIVDGLQDPWRSATPHASGLPDRESTTSEPFMLIDWGVHHWDEFGLPEDVHVEGLPPPQVAEAHMAEIEFVKAWLEGWKEGNGRSMLQSMDEEETMGEL
ncbi:hypothetical protein TgHK011_010153 [Trichoderma gracile]|nr:hypothetical protein TgHK011_010153 [Trichoderma gracile]